MYVRGYGNKCLLLFEKVLGVPGRAQGPSLQLEDTCKHKWWQGLAPLPKFNAKKSKWIVCESLCVL